MSQGVTEEKSASGKAAKRFRASSAAKARGIVSSITPPSGSNKLMYVAFVAILGLLLIGAVFYKQITQQSAEATICTTKVLQQARPALTRDATTELGKIVTDAQKHDNFSQDANCLYMAAIYYVNIEDTDNADKMLTKFDKVYDAEKGIAAELQGSSYSNPDNLRARIAFLKSLRDDVRSNTHNIEAKQ